MATSREDPRPLRRCGRRADSRLRYPATYTTPRDVTWPKMGRVACDRPPVAGWMVMVLTDRTPTVDQSRS